MCQGRMRAIAIRDPTSSDFLSQLVWFLNLERVVSASALGQPLGLAFRIDAPGGRHVPQSGG